MTGLGKTESILLAGFISAVSVPLLYMARALDSNTLSSWRWILNSNSIGVIFSFSLLAAAGSYLLSRTALFERHPLFWLFLLSFLLSASLWQEPELLLDSGRYFLQAKQLSEYGPAYFIGQWGGEIPAWTDLPLGPFLYGMLFRLFGEHREVLQLFNSVLFSLSVVLTSLIAGKVMHRESAFLAGLLLLGMPYLLTQVPLLLVDIHALFFFSLALYTFLNALVDGGKLRICGAAAAIVGAMLSKYSIWPMLLFLPLLASGFCGQDGGIRFRRALAVALLAGFVAGLIFLQHGGLVRAQMHVLAAYQRPALAVWHEGLLSTFLFQMHPFIAAGACAGFLMAVRRVDLPLLLVGAALLFFFSQIQRIRYIIPLLPLLAIMAASGLQLLSSQQTRRFVCWLCAGFSLILLHGATLPFFETTCMRNIQNAGRFLDTLPAEAVEVVTLPQEASEAPTSPAIAQLDLFTHKKIIAPQSWASSLQLPQGYQPLLFTWQMKKPLFYAAYKEGLGRRHLPLVVISGAAIDDAVAADFREDFQPAQIRRFTAHSGVFRYKTFVTVFY